MQPANIERLGNLPIWAQVLIGHRALSRYRAALAADQQQPILRATSRVLESIAQCIRLGGGCEHARRIRRSDRESIHSGSAMRPLVTALAGLAEACRAAENIKDGLPDTAVTRAVWNSLKTPLDDRRVNRIQWQILLSADFDNVHFACKDADATHRAGLPEGVFERLAPTHPVDLLPEFVEPEAAYR